MILDSVERSWPTLSESDSRKVSQGDCEHWLIKYQKKYAPSVVNNSIAVLRAVFQEAIRAGARFNNPTAELSRMRLAWRGIQITSRVMTTLMMIKSGNCRGVN
jgi:site-specific recombinase XerD